MSTGDLKAIVREKYGEAALRASTGGRSSCCGSSCGCDTADPITSDLYSQAETAVLPEGAVLASLGCGNPTALAELREGEVVLDLGSGGGADVLISARRVGPAGRAFGLDMTDEMLELARANAAEAGVENVEFLKGYLEDVPLPDASVDVVISNCVINLSPDKPAVFREIWRVLRDGGRTVIADIVADGEVPPPMRADGQLWGECISGALSEDGLLAALERAGFYGISVLRKTFWREVEGTRFYSVTVRGFKFEKKAGCRYIGQYAVYLGPMKSVTDEEGHLFPRGIPVEVCSDTATKLAAAPYASAFAVIEGEAGSASFSSGEDCCGPDGNCC